MINPPRRRTPSSFLAVIFLLLTAGLLPLRALEPNDWKYRQPLAVPQPGVLKFALPPETLGLARAGLDDLRLLDPAGHEVPFVFTAPAPAVPPAVRAPASFHASLLPTATELFVETGTLAPLEAVTFSTPASHFLKPARLEISSDGAKWESLAEATAVFRQFGAEHVRFALGHRSAAYIRLTLDDSKNHPVPFTGASLEIAGAISPEITTAIPVRIVRREEFAGETVLTLDLGGAHVPLASVAFVTSEPLFARTVTFATRELRDENAVSRSLAHGSIWRVSADGVRASERLDVPTDFTTSSRELLVHIANGDSPPLPIDSVTAHQRPVWLVFRAAQSGTYTLLTGNPQVLAPRYDLATLATALRDTPPSPLTIGPAELNQSFHTPDLLADAPILGAAIDPTPWLYHKSVQIASAGVQQLELDLDVLAHSQRDEGDLRLVRDDHQVPYLLERTNLSRNTALEFHPVSDPKHPALSRWQVMLPRARVPFTRLTLTSSTAVFQRQLKFFERVPAERAGESNERLLAWIEWSHTPAEARVLSVDLAAAIDGESFFIEADNGDNPPITLTSVQATYPVVRLLFRSEAAGLTLYYGNTAVPAPRYDLALVAAPILAAEKSTAILGPEQGAASGEHASTFAGLRTGPIFWTVLTLVVLALLAIVAKLLPAAPK